MFSRIKITSAIFAWLLATGVTSSLCETHKDCHKSHENMSLYCGIDPIHSSPRYGETKVCFTCPRHKRKCRVDNDSKACEEYCFGDKYTGSHINSTDERLQTPPPPKEPLPTPPRYDNGQKTVNKTTVVVVILSIGIVTFIIIALVVLYLKPKWRETIRNCCCARCPRPRDRHNNNNNKHLNQPPKLFRVAFNRTAAVHSPTQTRRPLQRPLSVSSDDTMPESSTASGSDVSSDVTREEIFVIDETKTTKTDNAFAQPLANAQPLVPAVSAEQQAAADAQQRQQAVIDGRAQQIAACLVLALAQQPPPIIVQPPPVAIIAQNQQQANGGVTWIKTQNTEPHTQ